MNFKKYHVSRNLWDKGVPKYVYAKDYKKYNPDNAISLRAGTYTISSDGKLPIIQVFNADHTQLNVDGAITFSAGYYQMWDGLAIGPQAGIYHTITITLLSDCILTITVSDNLGTYIMLNSGSEALPYEPYTSEVWHDIPHYVHNTSTDTITTLPAVIYPNDTAATVGLKGNMQQSGTPTPQNPVMPQGCGERTGNLCLVSQSNSIYYAALNKYSVNNNSVTVTGEALFGFICKVSPNTDYTVSAYADKTGAQLRIREYSDVPTEWMTNYVNQPINKPLSTYAVNSFTTDSLTNYLLVTFYAPFVVTLINIFNIMLNSGSTALPYEPFGVKIPISSASTTTPIYLGEVETTRKIKKYVVTGQESEWNYDSTYTRFTLRIPNAYFTANRSDETPCTHYVSIHDGRPVGDVPDKSIYTTSGGGAVYINIVDLTYSSLSDFKAYLQQQYAAGTPVTVWYVLATPTTGIVNEPLMRIGGYADEVSNVSIPVTAGGDTISVDTTVQPSEVTVNYKGWHPVQSVHERDNGAWT